MILRHALSQYSDEAGRLWIFLADYETRLGLFGKARDAFEEALAQLNRARDFGIIFNAYMKFEEAMLELDVEDSSSSESEENSDESEEESLSSQIDMLLDFTYKDIPERSQENEEDNTAKLTKEDKENMKFFRLENLIERRPFLLSNVVLRQNPNNVNEWISRLKLCKEDVYLAIKTFTEAIQAIDPLHAVGKASKIWIEFASFYEQYDEIENANVIFHRASQLEFRSIEELACVYCAWAEMHVRHGNVDSATEIMKFGCNKPPPSSGMKK